MILLGILLFIAMLVAYGVASVAVIIFVLALLLGGKK